MAFPTRPRILSGTLPASAVITEVAPRDGLQSIPQVVAPALRAGLVTLLIEAGFPEVEAGSFVNPALVPQMADTGKVFKMLGAKARERAFALVPNMRGLDEAMDSGVLNVLFVASATETHSLANLGRPVGRVFGDLEKMAARAKNEGIRTRAALSVAFVDPSEGIVPPGAAAALVKRFREMGIEEITLCDTHGGATPDGVDALLGEISEIYGPGYIGLHMHDTFGFASANVLMGLTLGISRFDSSVNGLGGCPFLPGSRGNMNSADLVRFLNGLGVSTGITLENANEAARKAAVIISGGAES